MCGISSVGGASGSAPPMKVGQTDVAGANGGAAPSKVAGASGAGTDATQVGGAADASKGATQVAGGGGSDLKSALDALMASVKSLADVVAKMVGTSGGGGASGCDMHGKVAGVRGTAATAQQYVARSVSYSHADNSGEDHTYEARVLELINLERAKYGLGSVRYNGTLDNAAEKHATHMAIVGQMAHGGIGDGDPGERIRAEGFRDSWGENVATGQRSPEQVVREWMNSPTHRANILDPNFKQMGVSYVTSSTGRSYWAQEFGA